MTAEQLAGQQLLAAWVAAGAAIVQAIGAVAAIWASLRIASSAERRAAASEAASLERERLAEAAASARADAAEAEAEQRYVSKEVVRRQQTARLVDRGAQRLLAELGTDAAQHESQRALPVTVIGQFGSLEKDRLLKFVEELRNRTPDLDLVEDMIAVEEAVAMIKQPQRTAQSYEGYVDWNRQRITQIKAAIHALTERAAGPFMPS